MRRLTHRRQCSAPDIPDQPKPAAPKPVIAPELEIDDEDGKKRGKKKKRLGKQALRLTGLTIGGALRAGAGAAKSSSGASGLRA
jgi:hypothetical protein